MIYIMDTTLRDGEQTSGVSFSELEKLNIAKILLDELRIDFIEVASARVSDGEFRGAKKVLDWATQSGYLDRVEILGFVDGKNFNRMDLTRRRKSDESLSQGGRSGM